LRLKSLSELKPDAAIAKVIDKAPAVRNVFLTLFNGNNLPASLFNSLVFFFEFLSNFLFFIKPPERL
jgi:hypothetical protein